MYSIGVIMINKRDYKFLSDEETLEVEEIKKSEIVSRSCLFHKYSKAARHNIQLFPNHYLDIMELRNTVLLKSRVSEFTKVLNSKDVTERKILNQINSNEDFFIIGSLLKKYYNFGHHEAHVFREFPLGTSFKADYLILGLNSDGWHFIFVELEAPVGNITIGNGDLGNVFRKGIIQIGDWDEWLELNFNSLQEFFYKHVKKGKFLPDEFLRLDKSRVNYAVIAGRRKDFRKKTYRIQRKAIKEQQINLIHYDNVLDAVDTLFSGSAY